MNNHPLPLLSHFPLWFFSPFLRCTFAVRPSLPFLPALQPFLLFAASLVLPLLLEGH
jgi:hypothetical protein